MLSKSIQTEIKDKAHYTNQTKTIQKSFTRVTLEKKSWSLVDLFREDSRTEKLYKKNIWDCNI